MISRHQNAPENVSIARNEVDRHADAEEESDGMVLANGGMDLKQLNRKFPIGHRIEGQCNFVIFDKDKTKIQELFPNPADNSNAFKYRFRIHRTGETDVLIEFFNAGGEAVFRHWAMFELDYDQRIQHLQFLACNTLQNADTTQRKLDVSFKPEDKEKFDDFIKMYEYGRCLAGYPGVRFGKRN